MTGPAVMNATDAAPAPALRVRINDVAHTLTAPATVADAVARIRAVAPFAVAVNRAFVPRSLHATRALAEGDRVEVIRPVTGG